MTKEEQFAYCAGLMDGEGCFHASRNDHCNTFRYGITINIDFEKPLLRVAGIFGGEVKPRLDGGFSWAIPRRFLIRCLEAVTPYLMVKREQAQLLHELRETFLNTNRKRGQKPTAEVVEIRQRLTDRITRLKEEYSLKPIPTMTKMCGWAYTAGLLDAEGSFGVYRGVGNRYCPKVQVGMVDPTSVTMVKNLFGGLLQKSLGSHKNAVYHLSLERGYAAEIIRKTAAYRLLKREQADIVVRLVNHIQLWQSRRGNQPLPFKVIAQRERWYKKSRSLNSISARAETNSNRGQSGLSDSPTHTEPKGMELAEMSSRYAVA